MYNKKNNNAYLFDYVAYTITFISNDLTLAPRQAPMKEALLAVQPPQRMVVLTASSSWLWVTAAWSAPWNAPGTAGTPRPRTKEHGEPRNTENPNVQEPRIKEHHTPLTQEQTQKKKRGGEGWK